MEKWTVEMEADLQALARLAALHVPESPIPAPVVSEAVQETGGLAQRAALRELTLDVYERWAATYPGAADALERSMENVTTTMGARDVAQQIHLAQVSLGPDDWVDEERLQVLYGPEPPVPWRPPVVQVEQYLAWSGPALLARVTGWCRTWPRNAPLLPS